MCLAKGCGVFQPDIPMTNRFDHTDPADPNIINVNSSGWNSEILFVQFYSVRHINRVMQTLPHVRFF
jgi:hypothetical protein